MKTNVLISTLFIFSIFILFGCTQSNNSNSSLSIADILNNPSHFVDKTVELTVHPAGWSCPVNKTTELPEVLSRSAFMVYDSSGCIYGTWNITSGKIRTDLHPIYEPGNETIKIRAIVRISPKGVPYLSAK